MKSEQNQGMLPVLKSEDRLEQRKKRHLETKGNVNVHIVQLPRRQCALMTVTKKSAMFQWLV